MAAIYQRIRPLRPVVGSSILAMVLDSLIGLAGVLA